MLISAIIVLFAGAITTIYAISQRATGEYMLASAFGSEEAMMIDIVLYVGIGVIVIGAIIMIAYFIKKTKNQ